MVSSHGRLTRPLALRAHYERSTSPRATASARPRSAPASCGAARPFGRFAATCAARLRAVGSSGEGPRQPSSGTPARLDPERATGLDYYPLAKSGERFPIADPVLPPRLAPRPTDDAVFLQGMLEGIAAIEALGYRTLAELSGPSVTRVFTAGGGAVNRAWTRIRERTLGVPVLPARDRDAAVGTARLAASASG